MSAFVMTHAGFNDLANELTVRAEDSNKVVDLDYCVAHDVRTFLGLRTAYIAAFDRATEVTQELFRANVEAVNQRYSHRDDLPAQAEPEFHRVSYSPQWTPVQLLKHLQCLRYQMSEGDVPETEIYKRLTTLISDVALSIATNTVEYRQAAWDFREAAVAAR